MRRSYNFVKFRLAANLICLLICGQISAQTKTAANLLAGFEKSIEQGKISEIERPLLNYAIANPNEPKILGLLAQVRVRQGRFAEAKGLYERVLTLDPSAVSAKINLGRIAFALGQKEKAREVLNEIAALPTIPPASQLDLATALFSVGEFQKALSFADKLPLKLKNNEALPVMAAIYLESGDKQKLKNLIPLMKKSAANPATAISCAEVLQNAGMNREAADLLRSTLAAAPNNVNVLVRLGRLEIDARDFAPAKRHLDLANKSKPGSPEILSAQALLESVQGNLAAAFDLLAEARRLAPNSPIVLADFVILAMRSNRPSLAVEAAKTLVNLNSENPEYKYLLGASFLQNGNIAAAQENLESFTQQRPTDSRGCLALGLTFAAQRDQIEKARKQLNYCLEINSQNYEAKYQLGLSYKTQGETERAVYWFEETVKSAPNYALVLRDLGALYLQSGAEAKAQIVLEKAAALDPNDADTHFQLSRLYNLIGKSELAKQQLEMFQKIRNGGKVSP